MTDTPHTGFLPNTHTHTHKSGQRHRVGGKNISSMGSQGNNSQVLTTTTYIFLLK